MPDGVGERFGDDEVGGGLDGRGEPRAGAVELDGQGSAASQRLDGGGQAAFGKDRGVDAAGQPTQLGHGLVEPLPGLGQQFLQNAVVAMMGGVLGAGEVDGHGEELLLRAVV